MGKMKPFLIFESLGTKLSLMVTIAILFVSISIGLFIIKHSEGILEENLKNRGADIAKGLAFTATQHFIQDNRWDLYKNLKNLIKNSDIVVYSMATDLKGEIIVHSNPKKFPMGMYLDDQITAATLGTNDILIQSTTDNIYDIAFPIFYNNIPKGIVRVGITKKLVKEEISEAKRNLILVSLIFSLIGIIGAIIFSRTISNPLHKLSLAAESISQGKWEHGLDIKRTGEVGRLIDSFNAMVYNMKNANVELERLSTTDDVTGIHNHRYFYKTLKAEFEKSKRYNYSIACIMFDIDFFKSINDIYGHQIGDSVLRELGSVTASNLRSTDTLSRYGGDEFIILLSHTDEESALSFAEKIRASIEGYNFSHNEYPIKTTISIGVSVFPNVNITIPDDMIKNADLSLYKAKSSGRNRISVWNSDLAEELIVDNNSIDLNDIDGLKQHFNSLFNDIKERYKKDISSLIERVGKKDAYLDIHSQNVAMYAVKFARKLNLPESEIATIYYASILHDVGKIGIKLRILRKTGRLTKDEYNSIKKHPLIAVNVLEGKLFEKELSIIRHHHERYDGMGYPNGLSGKDIPFGARILMLADAFDVITSERLYKDAKTIEEAIAELKACSGSQFDPDLVDAFLEMLKNRDI